jgi:hypothetical protein
MDLDGRHPRAQINGVHGISDPPLLSTFKRKGGVRNPGCTPSMVKIKAPGSTACEAIPDPPHLSTFKRRGGGSGIEGASLRRLRSQHLNQRRIGDLASRCLSVFNHVAPPFPIVSYVPSFPLPFVSFLAV